MAIRKKVNEQVAEIVEPAASMDLMHQMLSRIKPNKGGKVNVRAEYISRVAGVALDKVRKEPERV